MHRLSIAVVIALACSQFVIALPAPREVAAKNATAQGVLAQSTKSLTTDLHTTNNGTTNGLLDHSVKNATSHEGSKQSRKGSNRGNATDLSVSYLSSH
jgi:hypothetical protein